MDTMFIPPNCRQFTLYDRVSKLLESFEWSDVSFLVGNEIIRAHKLILAISSPVFKVMLYGPMAEPTEIIISDIEPEVFQLLLDFIYRDKVSINSLENACGLLYAAKKYMLPYLIEICLKYIEDSTSIKNVISVFGFSDWIQEENLLNHCLTLICKHADVIFANEFDHISGICLGKILQQSSINLSEKELINVAVKWANDECLERGLTPLKDNKRQLLFGSNIMSNLRFLTLSSEDLDWLNSLDILTESEIERIKAHVTSDTEAKEQLKIKLENSTNEESQMICDTKIIFLNMNTVPRNPLRLDWSNCCRPVIRTANPLLISDEFQTIKVRMKCQKTVFVKSFIIPSRQSLNIFCNDSLTTYSEHIILLVSNTMNSDECLSVTFNKNIDYNGIINIELPKAFILNEDDWYTVSFTWPGKKSQTYRYPLCYRPTTTYNAEAIFTFDDNFENLSPCGSFVEGLKFCI